MEAKVSSDIMELIDKMTAEETKALAKRLTPLISHELMLTPTIWGSRARLHLGKGVVLINTLFNLSSGDVHIGDFVFFGHNVSVLTGTHAIDQFDLARQCSIPLSGRDVIIEKGVWIATNATIIGPCRIGENAVIGVGSVVMEDVRAGWFYAGVPAKPIKPVSPEYADPSVCAAARSPEAI
ncbi:acyltransferase [Methylocystis borbori]|uniref:acyltransferase n=1 Tax=Methylocystis borbori TaxID=3118750 RepID=UPI002F96D56A